MLRRKSRVVKLFVALVAVYVITCGSNASWLWSTVVSPRSTLLGFSKYSTDNPKTFLFEATLDYNNTSEAPVTERDISKETGQKLQHIRLEKSINSIKRTTVNSTAVDLNDVFITIKTTKKFHHSRLDLLLSTWFRIAKDQVCKMYII